MFSVAAKAQSVSTKLLTPQPSMPKLESKESIEKYLQEIGVPFATCYYVRDSSIFKLFSRRYSFPTVLIFNGDGKLVKYTPSRYSCSDPTILLKDLSVVRDYPIDENFKLEEAFGDIASYDSLPFQKAKITVLVYWAIFPGYVLNNEKVKRWCQILQRYDNSEVQVIMINMDAQAVWQPVFQKATLSIYNQLFEAVQSGD